MGWLQALRPGLYSDGLKGTGRTTKETVAKADGGTDEESAQPENDYGPHA
jgi:hypothetical protein